jgi:nitroreductase
MPVISDAAIKQLFTEAHTHTAWLPAEVSDQTLHDLYDLMKLGPTSANSCPARIVFIRGGPAKEKLLTCLFPPNVDKVKAAPVTAIIAMDELFYDQLPKLSPHADYRPMFASNKAMADETAFRNSSLQGGYFILAARALGLDTGPMSGFNKARCDELFFAGTSWKSNFLCNLGHGDASKLHPRNPRLSFDEACKIL